MNSEEFTPHSSNEKRVPKASGVSNASEFVNTSNASDHKPLLSEGEIEVKTVEIANNETDCEEAKPKVAHIITLVIVVTMNYVASRYTVGSQLYPMLAVKLDWDSDKEVQ